MTIRPATDADVDAIRRVADRSWKTDYPDIMSRETVDEAVDDWYSPENIADQLDSHRTIVLVADREDGVVGFAHATWSVAEEAGYIFRIYVDPDHRRENVGRELLERTCADLAERGARRINAMVLASNDPGNSFYEHFGFDCVDEGETRIGGETYLENRYVLGANEPVVVD